MPRKPKQSTKQSKAADLINLVKTLDKDSLLKLVDVLATIKDQSKDQTKKTTGKKRGRPKKIDVKPETDIMETEAEVDDDDQPQPRRTPRKPRQPRQLNAGKQKGSQARVEPFTAIKKRPNLFLKSKFANAHKDDSIIDKKLSTGREPTERGVRNELVEICCIDCGKSYIINEDLVFMDPDEGPKYHCGCLSRGKNNK